MSLYIQQVSDTLVSALVDFDYTTGAVNGTGQYLVTGVFDENSECSSVDFFPTANAWQTGHPSLVPARMLTASLSDDHQTLDGGYKLNTKCACLGVAPSNAAGVGSTCALNDQAVPWCFVAQGCADAVASSQYPGWYTAPCGAAFVTCSGFSLSRICSAYRPACDPGWTAYNLRYAHDSALACVVPVLDCLVAA